MPTKRENMKTHWVTTRKALVNRREGDGGLVEWGGAGVLGRRSHNRVEMLPYGHYVCFFSFSKSCPSGRLVPRVPFLDRPSLPLAPPLPFRLLYGRIEVRKKSGHEGNDTSPGRRLHEARRRFEGGGGKRARSGPKPREEG